jgi:hypothetical protein
MKKMKVMKKMKGEFGNGRMREFENGGMRKM